jgi:hypothetical protein
MKLNYRNTFYVGLIFFIISLFWQTYDMMIARTMIDKFGLNQTWSGIVMAVDNVMAVILLPLFGALSDKSNSKKGRRTPYIIVGTVLSAVAFMALSYADYVQTLKIQATNVVEYHYDVAFGDDVDSSEMAFKMAASLAFKKGMEEAQPILLEPIMSLKITVPEEYMGDVMGDINKRRGKILGMEPFGQGKQVIYAHAPQSETFKYAIDLRSMTQGRGYFEMEIEKYEEVPYHIAQKIIENANNK